MTKYQAGIAVLALALAAGGAIGGYRLFQPEMLVPSAPQILPGTPIAVAADFIRGIQEGQGELIRQTVLMTDADEAEIVNAIVEHSQSIASLSKASARAFGRTRMRSYGLPIVRIHIGGGPEQEVVDDDLAEVDLRPGSNPNVIHLRKVEGQWKVVVRDTFYQSGLDPRSSATGMVPILRLQSGVYAGLCKDIDAGIFATLEEANMAMSRRLAEAMQQAWLPNNAGPDPAAVAEP